MPFDDDDTPFTHPTATNLQESPVTHPKENEKDEDEDEEIDLQKFISLFDRRGIVSQAIRRGEKDFESHGTKAQENLLEASRQVLEEVLKEPRLQNESSWIRGWYFPSRWENVPPEEDEVVLGVSCPKESARKKGLFLRERVVIVEQPQSVIFKTIGRVIPGLSKKDHGYEKIWLLPEEALFLLDRGTLDLWWPTNSFEDIFPIASHPLSRGGIDNYEYGFPLSQEAAYSLLISDTAERGKVTLEQFQVYANLRRTGYIVFRAPQAFIPPGGGVIETSEPDQFSKANGIWSWMVSLILNRNRSSSHVTRTISNMGPLVQPGLYNNYRSIYEKLAIVPRHKPRQRHSCTQTEDPYKIFFFVWKSGRPEFPISVPPLPDFYMAVVDARITSMPTMDQISNLLATMPWNPPREGPNIYAKLKHGHRHVIIAVVDQGVINYYRLAEGAFGEQLLYPRFDNTRPAGGPKTSRGQRRGSGRGGKRGSKR